MNWPVPPRLHNLYWERRLGITTNGIVRFPGADEEIVHYGTVPYRDVHAVLDLLALSPQDVFVDLGCGKGRMLCCAALRGIRSAVGVELSADLAIIAAENARRLRPTHAPITVSALDVRRYDYTVGTVFYMFHPFGPNTMNGMLDALSDGLRRSPRTVRLVYLNAVHDDVLSRRPWLTPSARWEEGRFRPSPHSLSIWTSTIPV